MSQIASAAETRQSAESGTTSHSNGKNATQTRLSKSPKTLPSVPIMENFANAAAQLCFGCVSMMSKL